MKQCTITWKISYKIIHA